MNTDTNTNNKRSSSSISTSLCTTTAATTGITANTKRRLGVVIDTTATTTTTTTSNMGVKDSDFVTTLMGLPISVQIDIFNYLGETQEELRTLTLISKQSYEVCKQPGILWDLVPVFIITPSKSSADNVIDNDRLRADNDILRSERLFHNLHQHQQQHQRYHHMIVNEVQKFGFDTFFSIYSDFIRRIVHNTQLFGILSLDVSSSTTEWCDKYILLRALSFILPNLRVLDLSNTRFNTGGEFILGCFSRACPYLEKISLNNITIYNGNSVIDLDGRNIRHSTSTLREINMDGSMFTSIPCRYMKRISDLNRFPNIFLLYKCCNVLERLSMQYVTYLPRGKTMRIHSEYLPQNVLIKFVRNSPPTLKWFRSGLTQTNMDMLRLERPGIELVN